MAELKIENIRDSIPLIIETLDRLRRRQIDPRRATVIGSLVVVLIKVMDVSDFEQRLTRLESALVEANGRKS